MQYQLPKQFTAALAFIILAGRILPPAENMKEIWRLSTLRG